MNGSRFAIFLTTVLAIWAVMHAYAFWRVASVPWVASHLARRTLVFIALGLWAGYPLARMINSWGLQGFGWVLEFAAALWLGALLLIISSLLVVEVLTAGGWLFRDVAPAARGWALGVSGVLMTVALVQGVRPPVVREYEVTLAALPPERDGLRLVLISDLHLGTLIGQRWLGALVSRVNALRPDLVVAAGDVVDGEADRMQQLLPVLSKLQAPLGVWGVTGNHEYYAGLERSVAFLEQAGVKVLRDRAERVVPGLVLAGVDDLTAREQFGEADPVVGKVLAERPAGATILVSHTPWEAEVAAAAGAGLMVSGHTHNGQIWPFNYLVGLRYPLLAGRYEVNGMTVIVCRGTGTWGPRMRLWRPGEILLIRLRASSAGQ